MRWRGGRWRGTVGRQRSSSARRAPRGGAEEEEEEVTERESRVESQEGGRDRGEGETARGG